MAAKASLDDYPQLARWYADCRDPARLEAPEALVFGTCEAIQAIKAIDQGQTPAVRAWTRTFRKFLRTAGEPLRDFLVAEETVQRLDADLLDLIGELGETALRVGEDGSFLEAMQAGAEQTGLVVFRFLSAWTALNSGKLELCVEECEKVSEPFASVHTLHGQALLELGRPREALEALDVATSMGPQEILAWFQKAKALHVLGRHDQAFAALRECLRLAPQSDEVALYMALIAIETSDAPVWQEAWSVLRPRLGRLAETATVTLTLVRLAGLLQDKDKAQGVLAESGWSGDFSGASMTAALAATLRLLGERGWMDLAAVILGRATPAG